MAINTRNPECTFESEISLRNKPLKLNIEFDGCIDLYLMNKATKRRMTKNLTDKIQNRKDIILNKKYNPKLLEDSGICIYK